MADRRRYDVPIDDACTPGEARNLRYTVKEGAEGAETNVTDFSDYTEWECYVFPSLEAGGSSQAVRRANATFYVEADDMDVTTEPYVVVPMTAEQTALVDAGFPGHELWVKIDGAWTRVSYGTLPFVA